jgi:hypothetical protein
MTLYKYYNKTKGNYRIKREEHINDIEKEEKQSQKENKLGGINHFNKQMDEPEYVDLQKYYDKEIKTTILDSKNKKNLEI